MPASQNAQSGFSMVELLVAIVILAVGLLGLAQLQVTAIKANSQSATILAANAIAQKVVEEIAALNPSDGLFNIPVPGGWPATGTWPDTPITVAGAGSYAVTYSISPLEASGVPVTDVLQIEVVVTSTTEVANVLGNRVRSVTANTIKRAI